MQVVASFSVLGDMVKHVGGNKVDVRTLVGPNSDTHTYEPKPEDAKALANADLVIVNGLGLEGWMDRLIKASGTHAKIIIASEGVKPRTMTEEENGKKETVTDPHAWQDLRNGRIYARNIAAALANADKENGQTFRTQAALYDKDIASADADARAHIASIPEAKRKIITSHDAFGYFGAAYGVTFLSPVGINTEIEPTAADVARLCDQIKAEGVKGVFLENMANPTLIQQIAKDTGATMGGALYSDALSEPEGPAPTYLAMFANNVPKLVRAMKENAPK